MEKSTLIITIDYIICGMLKSVIVVWVIKQKFINPNNMRKKKGDKFMTNLNENEIQLINIIREHKHPEQALITAIETTVLYLEQLQSSAKPFVADSQALS